MDLATSIEVAAAAVGCVTGGGGIVGWVLWRFRRLGHAERDQIASDAAKNAVGALSVALDRYVTDLHDALGRVEELETRLTGANERIARLEGMLEAAHGERQRVQEQLEAAIFARARLEEELVRQRKRMTELENRLEAATTSR